MNKMTLLVAIDFSETGFTVLSKALSLADRHNAKTHVIHVVEESWYDLKQEIQSIREHSWNVLRKSFPQLSKKHFHCVQGNVIREIAETAEAIGATMLIIGSSGENYMFKEFLVGSTTKNIIRDATVPVLVVKNDLPLNPRRILMPTNFSEHSKAAIRQTASLFPDAQLSLLNTYDLPFEGRLKVYGFSEDDIIEYHMQIKEEEDEKAEQFTRSLGFAEEKIEMITRKGPLNPPLFLEMSKAYEADIIGIHTSGAVSFFAFDLLEEADHDVLIFRF